MCYLCIQVHVPQFDLYTFFLFQQIITPSIKWFTVEQRWRYERMIRGWRCEHYQLDVDINIIGVVEIMICEVINFWL